MIDIKETFLRLTSRTYPHGTEAELDDSLIEGFEQDEFGNRFIQIGDSTCMFTSHLDTATSANTEVIHVIEDNIIKTDGKSILGADDKAGVTIMLYMIENKVPGLYYFFVGEEVGCVGSKKLSEKISHVDYTMVTPFDKITKVISFDRRGYDSVITYQSSSRCCSDEFAQALADELNKHSMDSHETTNFAYKIDPSGIYTDSAKFTRIYPECSNISVGYKSEHTFSEQQDISHLIDLAKTCLKINWEELPVKRDKTKSEYKSYGGYGYGYWDNDWEDFYTANGVGTSGRTYYPPAKIEDDNVQFFDTDYNCIASVKRKKYSGKLLGIDICEERIEDERSIILDFLDSLDVNYEKITWDGFKLKVKHMPPQAHTTECDREELSEFLPILDFWKNVIENDYKQDWEKIY